MARRPLTFVIPIRHPEGVRDPALQQRVLGQTFRSIAAQASDAWRLVIACNPGQRLPDLPPRTEVRHIDLPPNRAFEEAQEREALYTALHLDKGARLLKGIEDLDPEDRFMVVDDDDFLSRRLAGFMAEDGEGAEGAWAVEKGWTWAPPGRWLRQLRPFHMYCGTSLVLPVRRMRIHAAPQDRDAALYELGDHATTSRNLRFEPEGLRMIPFHAVVYRFDRTNSTIRDYERVGLDRQVVRPRLRLSRNPVRLARRVARHVTGLRPVTPAVVREFFGGVLPTADAAPTAPPRQVQDAA